MMKRNKKKVLVILGTLLLLVVIAFFVFKSGVLNKSTEDPISSETADGINFDPPTEEEISAGDNQKEQNEQKEAGRNNQTSQTASVIITDAGQYDNTIEVRAFIPNHYEDGTCTIHFTKDSDEVKKDTPAYRDASTTICTNPLFERSDFPTSGDWKLKVTYKSAGASGTSESKTVNIQ